GGRGSTRWRCRPMPSWLGDCVPGRSRTATRSKGEKPWRWRLDVCSRLKTVIYASICFLASVELYLSFRFYTDRSKYSVLCTTVELQHTKYP
ncbi:unnamed protein product, partial [Discosporangium mesarthrocarpum]